MSSTIFVPYSTAIQASWLNDVNDTVYNALQLADYTTLRTYIGPRKSVYVTGYLVTTAPSGIAGMFVPDPSDTISTDNGGTIIVATNGIRWKRQFDGSLNVKWFGAKGDGVTDDLAAINQANAYVKLIHGSLEYPASVYLVSSAPNFSGTNNVEFIGRNATIYCTGPGPVAKIDAGVYPAYNDNVNLLGTWIFKGNVTSTYGLYTRGHVRSQMGLLRVANVASAAFRFEWSVLTKVDGLNCTNAMDVFTVNPINGIEIAASGTAKSTANIYNNVTMEAPISGKGIHVQAGDLNTFMSGSCESVPTGITIASGSIKNHFVSFDCEGNTGLDLDDSGQGTMYTNCAFSSVTAFNVILEPASSAIKFYGGYIGKIALNGTQTGPTLFSGVAFSDAAGITGSGYYTAHGCVKVNAAMQTTGEIDTGTFLPTIFGSTTPGTQTYSIQSGYYQRIGRTVHFQVSLSITANSGGTGTALLGPLPFTSLNVPNVQSEVVFSTNTGITFSSTRNKLVANISPNGSSAVLIENQNGTSSQSLPISSIGVGTYTITGSYLSN